MAEHPSTPLEAIKRMFHEKITARTEVTGGTWNAGTNTYESHDTASGVTTEYRLRNNARMESGLSATIKTYKDVPDVVSGSIKKTEVTFDEKKGEWVPKSSAAKAVDAIMKRPRLMATLTRKTEPSGGKADYMLVISPAKYKEHPVHPVFITPPSQPRTPVPRI